METPQGSDKEEMAGPRLARMERIVVRGSRYLTLLAVVGSLAGALLMFCIGLLNILAAYMLWLPGGEAEMELGEQEASAVISVIEGLDRFLIAIVLLYFAYGVYSLFIRPDHAESELSLPQWLNVRQVGQLKQVVAEVIIVVLFVQFLRLALGAFQGGSLPQEWSRLAALLVLPVATLLLSTALRLLELHPKPSRPAHQPEKELRTETEDTRS
ncbi:MAG: YqhA family protein [Acetobacterales bacterium]